MKHIKNDRSEGKEELTLGRILLLVVAGFFGYCSLQLFAHLFFTMVIPGFLNEILPQWWNPVAWIGFFIFLFFVIFISLILPIGVLILPILRAIGFTFIWFWEKE